MNYAQKRFPVILMVSLLYIKVLRSGWQVRAEMERVRFVVLIGIGETVLGPTPARVEDLPGRLGMMGTPPGATFQL